MHMITCCVVLCSRAHIPQIHSQGEYKILELTVSENRVCKLIIQTTKEIQNWM